MKLQKELLNQMADQHKLLFWISCFCVAMSKCLTRTSVRWFDFAEFCGGIQNFVGCISSQPRQLVTLCLLSGKNGRSSAGPCQKIANPTPSGLFFLGVSSKDSRTFYCKTNTQEPRSNTLVFGVMSHSEHSTDQQALFILY